MDEYIKKSSMLNVIPEPPEADYMDEYTSGYRSCALDVQEAIEAIPAADVVPVVHGEWKPHEDKQMAFGLTFECSCCGSIVLVNDALEFGYCPYCGAKMDGERKE